MKRTLTLLVCLILCTSVFAQSEHFLDRKKVFAQDINEGVKAYRPQAAEVEGKQTIKTEVLNGPELAKCDMFTNLSCEQVLNNETTVGAGNEFGISDYVDQGCLNAGPAFDGPDKMYKIQITQKSSVRIILDIIDAVDLDIFLFKSCQPIDCYAYSIENNNPTVGYREALDVSLDVGIYYLVVDGAAAAEQGRYNLRMKCACTCVEASNDMPTGDKIFCDNFEDYQVNMALNPQSTRWNLWPNATGDARVESSNGNIYARFQQSGTSKPDQVYWLDDQTTGRYRMSWRMFIPTGKAGYYNVLHRRPNVSPGANWAYHVFFNANGTGSVNVGSSTNPSSGNFFFPANQWFTVVNVVDINANKAELWVNGNIVSSWAFNTGSGGQSNVLAAINFFADNNHDFRVDDICIWTRLPNASCQQDPNGDVCTESGAKYATYAQSRCDLYTSQEWGVCNTVCDYGGTFIYRGETYNGSFGSSDFAPLSLREQPCIKSAYGPNMPSPLYAEIYMFYRNDNLDMNINFSTNNSATTKYFVFSCNFKPSCTRQEQCLSPSGGLFVPEPCDKLYYIVVTGTFGSTYSLNIVPTGPCGSGANNISCGQTLANQQTDNSLNFTSTTYAASYNGIKLYNGSERLYKFTLEQSQNVKIKVNSTAQVGVFLFTFLCGQNCIASAENSATTPNIELSAPFLEPGTYYIVVDKSTAGNATFSIGLECTATTIIKVIYDNAITCPANSTQVHEIKIPATAYPGISQADQIEFRYPLGSSLVTDTSLTRYWNGQSSMTFRAKKDADGDTLKCSYAPNDSFTLLLYRTSPGNNRYTPLVPYYAPLSPPGITDQGKFRVGGKSELLRLEEKPSVNFGTESTYWDASDKLSTKTLRFTTTQPWASSIPPSAQGWLSLSPTNNPDGTGDITITVQLNPNLTARQADIQIYSTDNPGLYRQFIRVRQKGVCGPPTLSLEAPVAVCAGDSAILTANVGAGLDNQYFYLWNTGDTTRSIRKLPTVSSSTYTVTIRNKDCDRSATATKNITVNSRPAAPTNPVDKTICAGDPIPNLSVTVPPGQMVQWFAGPTSVTPLSNSNNPSSLFTPTTAGTYYAQAFSNGCASELPRTAAKLTVNTIPSIASGTPICEDNLLFYRVVVTTTNANTMTSTAGTVDGGNGIFTVRDIPKGTSITVRATNTATGCFQEKNVAAPPCLCPTLNLPIPDPDQIICEGAAALPLSVTVGTNETADWYDQSTGGTLMSGGSGTLIFTPPGPGTYYAQARNLINGCTSATRVPVQLKVNPRPTLTLAVPAACSPNLMTYTLTVSSDANAVSVSTGTVTSNAPYEVSNVSVGTPVVVTARFTSTNCQRTLTVTSPVCSCPTVNKPTTSNSTVEVCAGITPPPLSVNVSSGETADWFDQAIGGQVLVGGAGTQQFAATASGVYYAQARNLTNSCVSAERTPITLTIHPLPTANVTDAMCDPSLQTYYVVLSTTNTSTITSSTGNVLNLGNGVFRVNNIAATSNVSISAVNQATGCQFVQPINKPNCSCPSILPPNSLGDVNICQGEPLQPLVVNVGTGETADWYGQATGGNVLPGGNNTLSFTPPAPGIYYAETQNTINACVSNIRKPVTLMVNPLPELTDQPPACEPSLLTYRVTLTSNVTAISHSAGTLSNSGGGTFVVSNIPKTANLTLTATDLSTGCTKSVVISPPNCDCPNVPKPLKIKDYAVCMQEPYPQMAVQVGAGETADWYEVEVGGSVVAGGSGTLNFTPTKAGNYYVQARNLVNGCTSQSRTAVKFDINPLPALTILSDTCSNDFQKYSVFISTNVNKLTVTVGDPVNLGGGQFLIRDIPIEFTSTVTATFNSTGCKNQILLLPPECICPVVDAPIAQPETTICQTDPIPALTVSVKSNETADWFGQAVGGQPYFTGIGTTSFVPPGTGTYYAQTRDLDNNCISVTRKALTLKANSPATAQAGPDKNICAGGTVMLSGEVTGVSSGSWKASVPNGKFIPNANTPGPVAYEPPPGVSKVTLTLTTDDPDGPCTPASDEMVLTVYPVPVINLESKKCAPNLLTYSVEFNSDGVELSANKGNLVAFGNGDYFIGDVMKGQDVQITALNPATGCVANLTVEAETCACPTIAPPASNGPVSICEGFSLPTLAALPVGKDQTVDWYAQAVGGSPLLGGTGTTLFKPNGAGTFYVEARDTVNGCRSATRTSIVFSVNPNPIAEAGGALGICPGRIATLQSNFNPNYTYQWDNGADEPIISVMPDTTTVYYLTVTLNGCTAEDSVVVTVFPVVIAQVDTVSEIKCFGQNTGALSAVVLSGEPLFQFAWSTGQTTQQISNLSSGFYALIVTDKNNCQDTVSAALTAPQPLIVTDVVIQNAYQQQANGSIQITVMGGIPPYSYAWRKQGIILAGESSALLDSIAAGMYEAIVTDANGCVVTTPVYNVMVPVSEPEWAKSVRIFPNPTDGKVYLQMELPLGERSQISMFDALGREQWSQLVQTGHSNTELDLMALPSGLYLVRINAGERYLTRKIVVEK